jgi:hypothetical protein
MLVAKAANGKSVKKTLALRLIILLGILWRKRVGVEPTVAAERRRPPVLKTGTITGPHALPLLATWRLVTRVPKINEWTLYKVWG